MTAWDHWVLASFTCCPLGAWVAAERPLVGLAVQCIGLVGLIAARRGPRWLTTSR